MKAGESIECGTHGEIPSNHDTAMFIGYRVFASPTADVRQIVAELGSLAGLPTRFRKWKAYFDI